MLRTLLFLLAIITIFPVRSSADFRAQIASDFAPFVAYLVMPVEAEWIIDAGAGKGTVTGDLFTLVRAGKEIIHPVSGEVLGKLDEVEALLEVSKVKSGYSYVTPLAGGDGLKTGAKLHRYQGVIALFRDDLGGGAPLFQFLEKTLPQLDWTLLRPGQKPEFDLERTGIIFLLDSKGLTVLTESKQVLHTYSRETFYDILPNVEKTIATTGGSLPPAVIIPSSQKPSKVSDDVIIHNQSPMEQGLWRGPKMEGKPVGIEIIDLDGDGKRETAICFEDRLEVGRVFDGVYTPLATIGIEPPLKPLTLDGADLDSDGRGELYITADRNMRIASFSVVFTQGKLSVLDEGVPWYFRTVNLEGAGRALLAQRPDDEVDFSGTVFHVERKGENLTEGREISLPAVLTLYGFHPYDHINSNKLYATLSTGDLLQAYTDDGIKLWESATPFGGTESSFQRPEKGMLDDMRYVFLKARIERLPDGHLILPVNEGSRLTAMREYRQSYISAQRWDGNAFLESWHTFPQGGYLADFRVADIDNDGKDELSTIVLFSRKAFLSKGKDSSTILVYEID